MATRISLEEFRKSKGMVKNPYTDARCKTELDKYPEKFIERIKANTLSENEILYLFRYYRKEIAAIIENKIKR